MLTSHFGERTLSDAESLKTNIEAAVRRIEMPQ
jgi:hypothetical protein